MRITIQVTCEDAEDAKQVIAKLAAPGNTWVDQLPKINVDAQREARIDKIMGSSAPQAAEQSGSDNGAIGAPRPNTSPGWDACQKIGSETKEKLLSELQHHSDPEHVSKRIKRTPDQTRALIQLLWNRGEIKYDGKEFYL